MNISISTNLMFLLLNAAVITTTTTTTHAFIPTAPTTRIPPSTTCATTTRLHSSKNVDDELNELEKARSNFEFLMHTEGLIKDNVDMPLPHTPEEYTPRPLTESSKLRRQMEMQLLASLTEGDDAIEELMEFWMIERGLEAAEQLQQMETICSPGLVQEEQILRNLLDEYGIHWAEPVSRLASLMYFKGNSVESQQWCEIALAVKPWHFEVIHTLVMNALRAEDLPAAVRWQRLALPPLNPTTNHKARKAWVNRALQAAQNSMDKAEAVAIAKKQEGRPSYVKETEAWQ